MLILPLAVVVGAVLGLLARDRPRAQWVLVVSAPVLSLLALASQFLPIGAESCTSTAGGSSVCQSVPAVTGWGSPLPYVIAVALVVLSLAPLVSLLTRSWLPAGVSALLPAVLLVGLALFVGSSMLCGLSGGMLSLVLFRALQGVGAGCVQPITLTIIGDLFPLQQRARMVGLFSAMWGVAALVGPLLGAVFVA